MGSGAANASPTWAATPRPARLAPVRASTYARFGSVDVLEVRELPEPPPRAGEARVRVHAGALNPKDVLLRRGKMRWLGPARFPRIPGYDFAGVLMDPAGDLAAGTEVFGMVDSNYGGACAEVVRVPVDELAAKPAALSMVEAAALPLVGLTALQGLRDELELRRGDRILLNGASGGVGTVAIQIAALLGGRVTAVCSGRNRDLVTGLGARQVIDYTRAPITGRYERIFDIFGTLPWPRAKPLLEPGGRYCTTIPRGANVARGALRRLGLHPAALVVVESRRRDLEHLARWATAGDLRPVVDSIFPLAEARDAHARLETRRAQGKVVLTLGAGA